MKHVKLFEQFISEKKSKSDYEDIIDKYESKIWELDNANASWIPTDSSKKEKMRQTFQKKIDAAQKALDKLDESLVNEARDITSVKRGDIIVHDETGKEYEVQDLIGKVHRLQSNKLRVVDMEGNVRVINPYKYSIKESLVNEARAPKTVDELKSALDDAYEKMNKYNEKYYSISKAPGGGSWSSNSKEGKAAAKYKKMANNQQANIWKWTDKLRKLGVEYISTNESLVNEENYQSPYIKNEKVTGKVYHVAGEPIKALNNRPMWFALEKEHSDDGWYANMIENGGAYQYSAKISGNICDVFEDRIQKLFQDNGLDTQEWETEIVGNPSAEEVMKLEGTKLLIKNGFAGAIYLDYDPRNFQEDLDALIIFDAKKSVKNWKLEKLEE